jgi:3-deoxy-D-manno-octulosonic-acid transferase
MENFSEIARLVVERGAGIQVKTPHELKEALGNVIAVPSLSKKMGDKGLALLKEHQGALERTLKIVKGLFRG